MRVLAEALDYARQGELAAARWARALAATCRGLRTIKHGRTPPRTVRVMDDFDNTDKPADKAVSRYSLRLPLPLAARLAAWCEMHPHRSRSELVAELLDAGLAQAEQAWAAVGAQAAAATAPDPGAPIYLPTGPFAEFHGLVRKHHLRLEHELDRDEAAAPSPAVDYLLGEE